MRVIEVLQKCEISVFEVNFLVNSAHHDAKLVCCLEAENELLNGGVASENVSEQGGRDKGRCTRTT